MKITLKESYRGVLFNPSSNNTPSSPLSSTVSIRKALSEVKYEDELPVVIGDYSYFFS